MSEKEKVCTISGVSPNKLPIALDRYELFSRIDEGIRKSILQGYTTFQTGMTMGVDIWAAETVLRLRSEFPEVRLICYLPYEKQADKWPNDWREKYFNALAEADDVICLQRHYTTGCIRRLICTMIDGSSRLIAVHNGVLSGSIAQAAYYAKTQGLEIFVINPCEKSS